MTDAIIAAGQRIMTGLAGTKTDRGFINAVKQYKIGNYILFSNNIESAAQLKTLCKELKDIAVSETGHIPFISADQEGGRVQRLPKSVIDTPSAREIAQSGNAEEAFLTGKRIGEAMREMGLNYDLAPVVDVESVCGNPAIGSRSFGTDAATVARFGAEMARGIQAAGVMACAKHFPGHGGTNVDTHKSLPTITLSMEELEAGPLVPFYAAIEAGVKSIMTTHIMFPALDKEYPGTLSGAVLSALLRGKMRYGGIIITDCLEMGAIASRYGAAEAAMLADGTITEPLSGSRTEQLLSCGGFRRADTIIVQFTTDFADDYAHPELVGKRIGMGDYDLVIDNVNLSFMRANITMHYEFSAAYTEDEIRQMTNLPNAWRVYVNGQTEAGYDAYANFQQVTNGAYGVDTPEQLTVGFDFYPAETDITRLTFVPIRNMGERWDACHPDAEKGFTLELQE